MDAVTAIVACSPAFFARAFEAIVEAGEEAGIASALARELVVGAFSGTAAALTASDGDGSALIEKVTSEAGSTEAGLEVIDAAGADQAYKSAVEAAIERCRDIGGADS